MSTGKNPTPLEERLSNAYFYEMKTVKKANYVVFVMEIFLLVQNIELQLYMKQNIIH